MDSKTEKIESEIQKILGDCISGEWRHVQHDEYPKIRAIVNNDQFAELTSSSQEVKEYPPANGNDDNDNDDDKGEIAINVYLIDKNTVQVTYKSEIAQCVCTELVLSPSNPWIIALETLKLYTHEE